MESTFATLALAIARFFSADRSFSQVALVVNGGLGNFESGRAAQDASANGWFNLNNAAHEGLRYQIFDKTDDGVTKVHSAEEPVLFDFLVTFWRTAGLAFTVDFAAFHAFLGQFTQRPGCVEMRCLPPAIPPNT